MAKQEEGREIQLKGKQNVTGAAEQTRPGPLFTPMVDICETENGITLLVDMPGVKPADLNIDLRENILTITGEISPFEGPDEQDLLIEYEVGQYFRQFTIPELIDRNRIDAQLKEGVLWLVLPKAEAAKPRKINIKSD